MVLENSKTTTFCFAFYLDPSSRPSSDHTVPKAFSGLEMFQNTPRRFPKYRRCCVGGWRGHTFRDMGGVVLRYGRCCVGGAGGQKFRDMGGAVSRYGRGCVGGERTKISRYGRCCFEI